VLGTDDKVTITDWFAAPNRQIEHIQAGGLELVAADVQALGDAYAAAGDATETTAICLSSSAVIGRKADFHLVSVYAPGFRCRSGNPAFSSKPSRLSMT
jgi:hypothetical protein